MESVPTDALIQLMLACDRASLIRSAAVCTSWRSCARSDPVMIRHFRWRFGSTYTAGGHVDGGPHGALPGVRSAQHLAAQTAADEAPHSRCQNAFNFYRHRKQIEAHVLVAVCKFAFASDLVRLVRVEGLVSRPELNGALAVQAGIVNERARLWTLAIECITVKPSCAVPVQELDAFEDLASA